jgi:hypothetical protein
MFHKHSLAGRLVVSKSLGAAIGILIVLVLPLIPVETTIEFKIGFVLLVMLMSTFIGLFGVFTHHPLFTNWNFTWWVRGPLVGAIFFLLLVLLAKDELGPFMSLDIVTWTGLTSPYWAILDGMLLGGLIEYITTKLCGEGDLPVK